MAAERCGYLVLTNISHRQWSYHIDERRQVIGRADDVDIPVPRDFDRVSRWHAEVWTERSGMWIRDIFRKLNLLSRVQLMGWIKRVNATDVPLRAAERKDQKR